MNFRRNLLSTVGAVAMIGGLFGGIASAQPADTDTDDAVLVVGCAETATVDIDVVGTFRVDASVAASSYDATLEDGFRITMDLTCNWSNDFQVSASIDDFEYVGDAPSGAADSFGGEHLRLDNGSGTYNGPEQYLVSGPPNIEGSVFEFFQTDDPDVIENAWDFVFIPWVYVGYAPIASPGVTVATWDGSLINLPSNLADGEYVAPLTVELTVN